MAQTTAIEWFWIHLPENISKEYFDLFEQAKAMEKEQIAKAWDGGHYRYFSSEITNEDFNNGDEYYEENYKNK